MNAGGDPAQLGQQVAEAIGDGPDAHRVLAQRERLIHASTSGRAAETRGRSRRLRWVAAAAAVVLIGIAGALAFRFATTPELPTVVAGDREGEWVQAPAAGAVEFALAEGTTVRLVEHAAGRVATPDAATGRVALEAGRLEAEVEPEAKRRWTVQAGPYTVAVVGTVFSVDWDPEAGAIEVDVLRGKVVVTGASIGAGKIAVEAGHRLRANHAERTVNLAPRSARDREVAAALAPTAAPVPDHAPEGTTTGRRSRPLREAAWRTAADAGNYRKAVTLANKRGFDRLVRSLPRADLQVLADAARLARDRPRARAAYEGLRRRFAGSQAAARAAFQLGRLSAAGGTAKQAARWFSTYLKESPRGTYAREARGRLVQSLRSAGDRAGARRAAAAYLESHPGGPHAPLARSIVEGSR